MMHNYWSEILSSGYQQMSLIYIANVGNTHQCYPALSYDECV